MKQAYKIVRNSNGDRAVRLANGATIPAGIAGLCTGKDKWLSEITCKCRVCGGLFALRELGETGQWCESCREEGITDQWRESCDATEIA